MPALKDFRVTDANLAEKIETGAWVRSYDFEFRDDCYVIGRVLGITEELDGLPRYEIEMWRRVSENTDLKGSINRTKSKVYPPINGTEHIFGGYTNGVRKLEGEDLEYWEERFADLSTDVDFD